MFFSLQIQIHWRSKSTTCSVGSRRRPQKGRPFSYHGTRVPSFLLEPELGSHGDTVCSHYVDLPYFSWLFSRSFWGSCCIEDPKEFMI
jgi:hypothetical protein